MLKSRVEGQPKHRILTAQKRKNRKPQHEHDHHPPLKKIPEFLENTIQKRSIDPHLAYLFAAENI